MELEGCTARQARLKEVRLEVDRFEAESTRHWGREGARDER